MKKRRIRDRSSLIREEGEQQIISAEHNITSAPVRTDAEDSCNNQQQRKKNDGPVFEMIRKHIVFSGWVQGVGFRYRARHAAALCGATGWVRNDPDGTVTMEIQGTEEQIDKVILAIERGTYIRIVSIDARTIPVVESERDFRTVR